MMSNSRRTYRELAKVLDLDTDVIERAGFSLDHDVPFNLDNSDNTKDIPVINDLRLVVTYETALTINGGIPNGNGANRVAAYQAIPPGRELTLVTVDSPQHIQNKVFNITSNEIVNTFQDNNTPTNLSREAKPLSFGPGPYRLSVTTTAAEYTKNVLIGGKFTAYLTPTVKIFINGQPNPLTVSYPPQGETTRNDSWVFQLQ